MWKCLKCQRIFEREKQGHSCRKMVLEEHFKNKAKARELFDYLVDKVDNEIGKCSIISLPCCVHLFGKYDFMAILPKKNKLEIRFSLERKLDSPRLKQSVPVSNKFVKNCIDVNFREEIDEELMGWLRESSRLKDDKTK